MASINEKIDRLQHEFRALSEEALKDDEARKKLLGVALEGMGTLETPVETIWRLIMTPHQTASLMTVMKMGLVPIICQMDDPVKADELAKTSGAERHLIVRLMRPLTALGIFKETDIETYTSTSISRMLMTPPLMGGFQFMFSAATRSLANMPFYLDSTGFKNVSGAPGPFQNAHETDLGLFPWLIADPPMLTHFNNFMSGQRMNRKDWYDFYPVDDILFKDANGDDSHATLLIDIAGGEGHDTEAFHKRFPNAPGKLLLQDLPATIDNIKHLDGAVVRMKYDFFTPQPIRGARAYYYRSIFHDWPDKDCISIMKNTAVAMKKGHSKLLIFEWILPDRSVPLYPALLDINMMALLNGMERTRAQWTALLEAAGLKVIKFWTVGDDVEGLIEAELM